MEIDKIVKQILDTFGEEGSPSFYIKQGIKRGYLILERFNNKDRTDGKLKVYVNRKDTTKYRDLKNMVE